MEWTTDKESTLECIRCNAIRMADYHKRRFIYYKGQLKYFRIPVIIISGINSVVSVGMTNYIDQSTISGVTCLLSLLCSIIGSVELFLQIQTSMEIELTSSKDFYLLGVDIFKTLSLQRENRIPNATSYLDEKYQTYTKLIEASQIVNHRMRDSLAPLPSITNGMPNTPSTSSLSILIPRTDNDSGSGSGSEL
jgi:hypothetical protein